MNRNLHSSSSLTEFARGPEEDSDKFVYKLVDRITNVYNTSFNIMNNFQNETNNDPGASTQCDLENTGVQIGDNMYEISTVSNTSASLNSTNPDVCGTETPTKKDILSVEDGEPTVTSILSRISNIVAGRNNHLQSYKNTELHNFWMPDEKAKECYDCTQKFTSFRRKHHCRLCGQIFCSKCCNQVVPGRIIKCSGDLKVCLHCSKVVLSYLKSYDEKVELELDLEAIRDDLSNKLSLQENQISKQISNSPKRKESIGYQEELFLSRRVSSLTDEDRKNILQHSNSLKGLHEEMLKNMPKQICGRELLTYLITSQQFANKLQAKAILNAMLAAGFLVPIVPDSEQTEFDESLHYKLTILIDSLHSREHCDNQNPGHNIEDPIMLTPNNIKDINYTDVFDYFNVSKSMETNNMLSETINVKQLLKTYCEYEEKLTEQLLRQEDLDFSWSNILIVLCARIVNKFHLEFSANDSIDIRSYVNFKKVPGGIKDDCCIFGGVSFTKNVAHKCMATKIKNPAVLLLQCPIMYERVEGKYMSMETLMLQEKEYLKNVVLRIIKFKPNIIVVQKSVAGAAQEIFLSYNVTLIYDVKQSVMERLAKSMQCDIVTSIESNINAPRLGTCDLFSVREFYNEKGNKKTIIFFEIFSTPRNYSFILRGGCFKELMKVKKVASTLLYTRFNWRFEMAFLLEVFAQPTTQFFNRQNIPSDFQADETMKQNLDNIQGKQSCKEIFQFITTEVDPIQKLANNLKYDNPKTESLMLSISPYVSQSALNARHDEIEHITEICLTAAEQNAISSQNMNEPIRSKKNETTDRYHEFLVTKINNDYQKLLAEFRAMGGKYSRTNELLKSVQSASHVVSSKINNYTLDWTICQYFPVLFCNYYYNPKAAASFCAQPTLLSMKFYGQNDIMLGQFLERYCFRSYICRGCNLPMTDHIRRYVHSRGCIQVQCSEDISKPSSEDISLTSWCTKCNEMAPKIRMSQDTWCLSLAKYLELRFHGNFRREVIKKESTNHKSEALENFLQYCHHSPQKDYVHYFSSRGIGVKFIYSSIEVWKINFPVLYIQFDTHRTTDPAIKEDIKSLVFKSVEIYSQIFGRIVSTLNEESPIILCLKSALAQDQAVFRYHIELIEILVRSEIQSVSINGVLVNAKRALADTVELWGSKITDINFNGIRNNLDKICLQMEYILIDNILNEFRNSPESTKIVRDNKEGFRQKNYIFDTHMIEQKISKFYQDCAVNKQKIKHVVTQLLPNSIQVLESPFRQHEHYALPQGEFPIIVDEHDFSSIIAYCITLNEYRKFVDKSSQHTYDTGSSSNLNSKWSVQHGLPDDDNREDYKTDDERKSKTKASHTEINFQDTSALFICKIYFTREFDSMRAQIFSATKEAQNFKDDHRSVNHNRISFARSLSKSVQWEARGGKSGLKFRKTLDNRFILKEMSKGDVVVFENFAPNYFDYINKCIHQEQLTLLAKILGVFKVTMKKKDLVQEKSLLVMENLFYGWDIKNKFDLKGSQRNRLANPDSNDGEIVLLDENLIKMSWSKPLYIFSYSKKILHDAINSDSAFLERNSIMDYSLLVGLNNKGNVLVLGIIDYIRTFTFDKRLESLVKQTGILGGQGKLPTVIAPQRYRQRFMEAMERYFLGVPKCCEET